MTQDSIIDRRGSGDRFYSRRIVMLAAAVAAFVAALCCVIVLLAVGSAQRREACERSNAIRAESNRRAPEHAQDALNLQRLAHGLGEHRGIEAATFALIGRRFHIEREVAPLVRVLRQGKTLDLRIAADQSKVRFRQLPLTTC